MARISLIQRDDADVRLVIDQPSYLDIIYSSSSLKQKSAGRHVTPFEHIILISSWPVFARPPILGQRSSKCQYHSLWFDRIAAWYHDLSHSMRTRYNYTTDTDVWSCYISFFWCKKYDILNVWGTDRISTFASSNSTLFGEVIWNRF
jgi:hypothetical protein